MKKFLKRSLSVILAITIIFASAAVALGEVDFSGLFAVEAHAASINDLSFMPSYDGRYMLVSGCNENATGEIVIPLSYGGCPVKSIGYSAFENCTKLTSIIMHDEIDYVNSNAFRNCTGLTSITIPDKVTRICDSTFAGCTNLQSIVIPDGVTSICSSAFAGTAFYNNEDNWVNNVLYMDNYLIKARDALSGKYTIKNGTKIISDSAFEDCTKLTSIEIPDSVTSIGSGAFSDCENLMAVTIFNSITSIGYNAFYNTSYYNNSNNWKNNVLYIGNHLIQAEIELSGEYIIKNGTKTIADSAFKDCTSLESVTIPDSVTKIGEWAFSGCTSITSVTIGDGVTSINDYAFCNCESLTSVTIGDSVTSIGVSAFSGCYNLASITIPVSVTSIGESAFNWCENLTDVYYGGTKDDWENIITNPYKYYGLMWAKIHYHEHSYNSDWITDTEATVNNAGSKHKECTECGEILETAIIPQLKPATPKVATTNEVEGIEVAWNAVGGAVKYNVYRRQAGQTAWILVGTTAGTEITDTKVTSGVYYCYSVRAYNNADQYSDYVAANTQNRKFMAVPKLTGISNATNGLYIKWNAVAGVTNGYRVYRRGAGQTTWTYLGTTKNTYYTDSAVKIKSGEYFRYTVIADGGYHSKFDINGLYLKRLENPALNSATSARAGITVKWGSVKGATSYYVYRKTASTGWTRIAVVSGNANVSYLDKTAKKGTTYIYTVRAVYGGTTSYFNSGISCKDKY